jgi:hypothetical protein
MKRYLSALALLLLATSLLPAQNLIPLPVIKQEGRGYESFVPKDWFIALADSGDLNNDMLEDYTLVLEANKDYLNTNGFNTKLNGAPRLLVILFGRPGDSLIFALRADSAILRSNGGDGDPLLQGSGLHTDGSIFELNYAGGVGVQWTSKYRFQYNLKTKEWLLVTYKGTEYNTLDEEAPLKNIEVDFTKKYAKDGKVRTPLPNLPKVTLDKFKPKTIEAMPGLVI